MCSDITWASAMGLPALAFAVLAGFALIVWSNK